MIHHADEFHRLRLQAINCFKYKSYKEGAQAADAAEKLCPEDVIANYYHAMLLLEVQRRDEGIEKLRLVASKAPRDIVAAASGHYLSRRLRVKEGYNFEDGWITMLEVAIESGLLPTYDLHFTEESKTTTSQRVFDPEIPKTIVQFWNSEVIPEEVGFLIETTKNANLDFDHRVYSEESARELIGSVLGSNAAELFDRCPHVAAKADFFRVVYLFNYGGFYLDADEVCSYSITKYLQPRHFNFIVSYTKALTSCINNWFIATVPHSVLLETVLNNLMGNLLQLSRVSGDPNIWVLTGPGVWTFSILDRAIDPLSYESGSPFKHSCFLEERHYRKVFHSPPMKYKTSPLGNWRMK